MRQCNKRPRPALPPSLFVSLLFFFAAGAPQVLPAEAQRVGHVGRQGMLLLREACNPHGYLRQGLLRRKWFKSNSNGYAKEHRNNDLNSNRNSEKKQRQQTAAASAAIAMAATTGPANSTSATTVGTSKTETTARQHCWLAATDQTFGDRCVYVRAQQQEQQHQYCFGWPE